MATQFDSARRTIQVLASGLPASCRDLVLPEECRSSDSGEPWPLACIEALFANLAAFNRQHPDSHVSGVLREIRYHKTSLDDARDRLICANLRLVIRTARKYWKSGLSLMDLVQDGNLGLLTAVEKFEPERGFRFSTYAVWWIRQGIQGGITNRSRMIRIPQQTGERLRKIQQAASELTQRLGRRATPNEVAMHANAPLDIVELAFSIGREPLPLEGMAGDRSSLNVAKLVPDVGAPSPFHLASQREMTVRIATVLEELEPREETVVRMRFGVGADGPQTLAEVAGHLRLSRERVRQIEVKALAKIRDSKLCRELATTRFSDAS